MFFGIRSSAIRNARNDYCLVCNNPVIHFERVFGHLCWIVGFVTSTEPEGIFTSTLGRLFCSQQHGVILRLVVFVNIWSRTKRFFS